MVVGSHEMEKGQATEVGHMETLLNSYDVVSFDVFDTLLLRKTINPEGVFHYIEAKTNKKGFAEKRVAAEEISRRISFTRYSSHETTLSGIYNVLYDNEKQRKKELEVEVEAERYCLLAYGDNKKIYDIAKSLNKKIIAVSDMYLSEELIDSILRANGIVVDKVFCSSSYYKENSCKANGRLYPVVCDELGVPPEKVIHFGDNYQSDFVNAMSHGIASVHTPTVRDRLFTDPRLNLHTLYLINIKNTFESNMVLGLVAKRHDEGYFEKNPVINMFGYLYAGTLMVAFIKNILSLSKKGNIKKILLMTRDGFVIDRVMDALGVNNIDYEIVYASRRMCLVPLLGMEEHCDWVLPILFPYREDADYNLKNDLIRLQLEVPTDFPIIKERDYTEYHNKIKKIGKSWLSVVDSERRLYTDYLKDIIGDTPLSEVAFVDVGWGLSSHRAIDVLLGKKTAGFYVGTHERAYASSRIHGLLFEKGVPEHLTNSIMGGVELIELIFSDTSPSAIRMKREKGKYLPVLEKRDVADRTRDWYVTNIHAAMMDFVADISSFFPYMSPEPIKNIASDCISNIITNASKPEREVLGRIPHAREVGHADFLTIAHWWRLGVPEDVGASENIGVPGSIGAPSGRVIPRSETVARNILNPILGKRYADWCIKFWNRQKRKVKSFF